jgi:hypothetical protein
LSGGVGKTNSNFDKLILGRAMGHEEMSFFSYLPVEQWRRLPGDRCYVCEKWKYVVYFYDRELHVQNRYYD